MRKILVAVDDSESSKAAFLKSIQLMRTAPNDIEDQRDMLEIVFVVEIQNPSIFDPFHEPLDRVWNYEQKEKAKKLQEEYSKLCQDYKIKNWKFQSVESDNARDTLCKFAEQEHADILVMGSRGNGLLKRMLLGSMSSYCSQNCKCPVMIVKAPTNDIVEDVVPEYKRST